MIASQFWFDCLFFVVVWVNFKLNEFHWIQQISVARVNGLWKKSIWNTTVVLCEKLSLFIQLRLAVYFVRFRSLSDCVWQNSLLLVFVLRETGDDRHDTPLLQVEKNEKWLTCLTSEEAVAAICELPRTFFYARLASTHTFSHDVCVCVWILFLTGVRVSRFHGVCMAIWCESYLRMTELHDVHGLGWWI